MDAKLHVPIITLSTKDTQMISLMEQLSDYSCKKYRDNYKLIAVNLSKQKVLDAGPR